MVSRLAVADNAYDSQPSGQPVVPLFYTGRVRSGKQGGTLEGVFELLAGIQTKNKQEYQ